MDGVEIRILVMVVDKISGTSYIPGNYNIRRSIYRVDG
jgi:hypothetical protein